MGLIFSLQLFMCVDINAGKFGDIKYVILFLISWSHVATTKKKIPEKSLFSQIKIEFMTMQKQRER